MIFYFFLFFATITMTAATSSAPAAAMMAIDQPGNPFDSSPPSLLPVVSSGFSVSAAV